MKIRAMGINASLDNRVCMGRVCCREAVTEPCFRATAVFHLLSSMPWLEGICAGVSCLIFFSLFHPVQEEPTKNSLQGNCTCCRALHDWDLSHYHRSPPLGRIHQQRCKWFDYTSVTSSVLFAPPKACQNYHVQCRNSEEKTCKQESNPLSCHTGICKQACSSGSRVLYLQLATWQWVHSWRGHLQGRDEFLSYRVEQFHFNATSLQRSACCVGEKLVGSSHFQYRSPTFSKGYLIAIQNTALLFSPLCLYDPLKADLMLAVDIVLLCDTLLLLPCAVWNCFTVGSCCLSLWKQQHFGHIGSSPGPDRRAQPSTQDSACGWQFCHVMSVRRSHPCSLKEKFS